MGGRVGIRRAAYGAALAAFSLLWSGPPPGVGQDASGQQPPPALLTADAGAFKRTIRRMPSSGGLRISYEWKDGRGVVRGIDVTIANAALAESEGSFGFSPEEFRRLLISAEIRIREALGLTAVDIADRAAAWTSDPSWCKVDEDPTTSFQFVLRTDGRGRAGYAAEIERIIRTTQEAWASSQHKIAPRIEKEAKDFVASRGMVMTPYGIDVNYKALVRENRSRLAPLAAEFKRICGSNKKALLDAVLSFVQNIPSQPRPTVEGEKYTAGLAVPLRVLADDSGDCDSKAVLFASLWTGLCRHRTILISVPKHMLVGVAVPFATGTAIEFDGICYVLLEVNCVKSLLPGEITRYTLDYLDRGQLRYRIVS